MPESHTDVQDLPAGYRMTELGPLPEEWRVVRLGEVAYVKQGRTPRREYYDDLTGYRIIKVKDFEDGAQVSVVPRGERSFTTIDLGDSVRVKAADILILNAGHSPQVVGQKVGIVPKALEGAFFVAELTVIRALQADPYFLFGVMMLPGTRNIIRSKVKGGHLYVSQLKTLPIPLPPLPEQRAIAHVLRAVQEAREATERVIAALRDLKRSLMRHLFTYGPVPVDQADQVALQDTPIGPIPAHWRVVRLGEVVTTFQYGLSVRAEREGRYPMLRMNNLEDGRVTTSDLKYINLSSAEATRFLLRPGDLLFNRTNSRDLVGKTALFDLDGKYVFASYLIRMSVDRSNIEPRFLNFLLNYAPVQQRLKSIATRGVSQANISASKLKAFAVSLPPLDEQRQIARILQTVDRKIEAEENRKRALDDLFKTLLHHLMTAKIRVPREAVKEFESLGIPGP